jgi:RimJ/RimL family protein N-acetyltransferase
MEQAANIGCSSAPQRREDGASRACLDHTAPMALPTPTLTTARLRLRPFAQTDTAAIFALHSSHRVLRYWDAPPWSARAQAERFIANCRQLEDDGTGARLAIERVSDTAFIGWCSLARWNADYRSASLGYCFDDAAWGQGFATEAAGAVLQWAFDTLDLNRVQAETDTRNAGSMRVLEKLGFAREGMLREDCIVDGEVSDSWVYGLLRRDWARTQADGPPRPPVAGSNAAAPVEYRLELCDTSAQHRPIAVIIAASPFVTVSVGDRFDDEGWPRLDASDPPGTPAIPRRYTVHSVKHVVTVEGDRIVARYCVNLTPFAGDRSPVWGAADPA